MSWVYSITYPAQKCFAGSDGVRVKVRVWGKGWDWLGQVKFSPHAPDADLALSFESTRVRMCTLLFIDR